jgi:hypothetical protein
MEKKDNMPLWVFLAFSSINTRKGALILISSCVVFSLYCIPWNHFFINQEWVGKVFLIDELDCNDGSSDFLVLVES